MTLEQIGRYKIKAELGRGGMATVYHAYDPRFKRDVAVKVLPREFLHNPTFRARFEREAQTIAALEHSAIVPVYDFGEEDGQPYLVMRFLKGGSLDEHLAEKGAYPPKKISRIFDRLAPALDEAHTQGIVHRDLKPGNIIFDRRGDAYLSDFGIAKLTEAGGATLTGGSVVGTPAYMSPEQARGESNIDGRSDIYAMGAILYEMLTGKTPYDSDTPMGMVVKHITEPVPRLSAANPELPEVYEDIISKSMAKAREDRYANAAELAAALRDAVAKHPVTSAMETTPSAKLPVIEETAHLPESEPVAEVEEPTSPAATVIETAPPTPVVTPEATASATVVETTPPPATASPEKSEQAKQPPAKKGIPLVAMLGGGFLIFILCVVIGGGAIMSAAQADEPTATATTPPTATLALIAATDNPPTATDLPPTETDVPTETPTPTLTPTPDFEFVEITGVTTNDSDQLVVEFVTYNYTPVLPGMHIHFFFNSVPPEQAGLPGDPGNWQIYGDTTPFTPTTITPSADDVHICALVANRDHTVIQGSGNCFDLP